MSKAKSKMKRSKFASLKPHEIRSVTAKPLCGCKCEHCVNYGLLRETLICHKFRCIPKKHSDLIEVQWCPFRNSEGKDGNSESVEFPKRVCVMD